MTEWLPEDVLFDDVREEFSELEVRADGDEFIWAESTVYAERLAYNDRMLTLVPEYDKDASEELRQQVIALQRPRGTGVKSRPEYEEVELEFMVRNLLLADSLVLSSFGLPKNKDGRAINDYNILGGRFRLSNMRYVQASFEERSALAIEAFEKSVAMIANKNNNAANYAFSITFAAIFHEDLKNYRRLFAPGVAYTSAATSEAIAELEYSLSLALQYLTSEPTQADLVAALRTVRKRKESRRRGEESGQEEDVPTQELAGWFEEVSPEDYKLTRSLLEAMRSTHFRQPLSLEQISEIQEANDELDWRETLVDPAALDYEDEITRIISSGQIIDAIAEDTDLLETHIGSIEMRYNNPEVVNGREVKTSLSDIADVYGVVRETARKRIARGLTLLALTAVELGFMEDSEEYRKFGRSRLVVNGDYFFSPPSHVEALEPRLHLSRQTRVQATGRRFSVENRLTYKPDPSEEN